MIVSAIKSQKQWKQKDSRFAGIKERAVKKKKRKNISGFMYLNLHSAWWEEINVRKNRKKNKKLVETSCRKIKVNSITTMRRRTNILSSKKRHTHTSPLRYKFYGLLLRLLSATFLKTSHRGKVPPPLSFSRAITRVKRGRRLCSDFSPPKKNDGAHQETDIVYPTRVRGWGGGEGKSDGGPR